MKTGFYITYADRQRISALHQSNVSYPDIAKILGVNLVTIYREMKRGSTGEIDQNGNRGYDADKAQRAVLENLSHKGRKKRKGES